MKNIKWLALVVIVGIFIISLPLLKYYLEVIKVFLSWPPIVLIISFYFLITFKEQLVNRLRNLKHLEAPGLILTMQSELVDNNEEQINQYIVQLQQHQEHINKQESYIEYWEFKYLNEVLAYETKSTLRKINERARTRSEINRILRQDIKVESETWQDSIINVLENVGLIQIGDKLTPTVRGSRFVFFLNWAIEEYGDLGDYSLHEQMQIKQQ